jgi:uncharacterized protein YbaR (Trm112 family)
MNRETKNCQNCQQSFLIEPDHFSFYEKIGIPAPNKCPDCRQQLRYAFRNERRLYRRNCDLCGKSTVTIYSPDKPFKVYCPPCFWGDGWDAKEYARDFDFSRPFFEQFYDLLLVAPRIALLTKNSINSEYANHSGDCKDCYLCFSVFNGENTLYCTNSWGGIKDSMDCFYTPNQVSFLYECIYSERVYNCQYCYLVRDSTDSMYSYDCRNCSNCFMCYNLRNMNYCIGNVQYSKEDYKKEMEKINLGSRVVRKELYEKYLSLIRNQAIHKYAMIERSVATTGHMASLCKNAQNIFDADQVEDTHFGILCPESKDSMDVYHVGLKSEVIYNSHGIVRSANVMCSHLCYDNTFVSYCDSCHNSQNLFGCVSIKKGEYLILNKKYTKEEYEILRDKIIEHMKKGGEWGEFFPAKFSPVCYNETQGQVYMPMEKDEALGVGFKWQENTGGTYGKETINLPPDNIGETHESITKEILACKKCTKNYNIVLAELELYKRMNVPVPEFCPDCRYLERQSIRNPRKLWHRACMCDKTVHDHGEKHCEVEFETSYALGRPEKVYCERCYQQEVL